MQSFLSLLRRRPDFRRLWLSNVSSSLGDWLSYVAVSVLVVREGGGPLALALVLVIHTLPQAALAPFAGVLADRRDRRAVMIGAHVVRAALTLGMAGAAYAGSVALVQGLLLLRVTVGAFFRPAERAALPRLVAPDEVVQANRLDALTWSVLFTGGVALGGVLAAFVGPVVALLIDAGTFVLGAAVLRGLPSLPPSGPVEPRRGLDVAGGWRAARRQPALLRATLAKGPVLIASGGGWVTLNLAALSVDAGIDGALLLGLLQAARGLGTGVGPLFAPADADGRRGDPLTIAGAAAFALLTLWTSWLPLWLLVGFLWGVGSGNSWVWTTSTVQRLGDDAVMGRLNALDLVAQTVGSSLGALAGGLLVAFSGVPAHAGLLGAALGVVALLALRRAAPYGGRSGGRGAMSSPPVAANVSQSAA